MQQERDQLRPLSIPSASHQPILHTTLFINLKDDRSNNIRYSTLSADIPQDMPMSIFLRLMPSILAKKYPQLLKGKEKIMCTLAVLTYSQREEERETRNLLQILSNPLNRFAPQNNSRIILHLFYSSKLQRLLFCKITLDDLD